MSEVGLREDVVQADSTEQELLNGRGSVNLPIVLSVGVATLLMLATLTALFMMTIHGCRLDELGAILFVFAPSTCLLAMTVTWRCVRKKRDRTDASSAVLSGATLAGGFNVPLVVTLIALFSMRDAADLMWSIVISSFVGIVLGCPFGFAFGAACLRPIRLGATRPRSFDASDAVSRTCWRWLATLSGVCGVLVVSAMMVFGGRQEGAIVLFAACCIFVALGLVMSVHADRKIAGRARWLDEVLAGQYPSWTVVHIDSLARKSVETLPAFLIEDEMASGAVLARRITPREDDGAYRTGELLEPVAVVSEFRL